MNLKRARVLKGVSIPTRPGAHHLGDFDTVAKIKSGNAAKVWAKKKQQAKNLDLLEKNVKEKVAAGW